MKKITKIGKESIKHLYRELYGYLDQSPSSVYDGSFRKMYRDELQVVDQAHYCIDKLSEITGENFERFKMKQNPDFDSVSVQTYRSQLSGLLYLVQGKYLPEETVPAQTSIGTVINNSIQNTMNVKIELERIIRTAEEKAETEEEKSFIKQVSESIQDVSSVAEGIQKILSIANAASIPIATALKLFS